MNSDSIRKLTDNFSFWQSHEIADLVLAFEESVSGSLPRCVCGELAFFKITGREASTVVIWHRCRGESAAFGYTVPDWLAHCTGLETTL